MKKIISQEKKEKKTKINQTIIGLLLILLMIFSTIGFAFSFNQEENNQEKIEYNNIEFIRDSSGYWTFEADGNKFYTIYNPVEISDIKISTNKKIGDYNNKPLYFVGEGFSELYKFLSNYAVRIGNACLDKNCKDDYPIKSCDNDNIIIIEEVLDVNGKEEIVEYKNCVYIKTKNINEAKYADAYIFNLLEIR